MLTPVCCSGCGKVFYIQAGELPDYPLCDGCKDLFEPRTRTSCEECPAKTDCEEA